jgi:uncharacterized protein YlxP (DUF503 family)
MLSVGLLTLHLKLPGCSSLKEKRGRIKPLLAQIQRDYKVSIAEVDFLDTWQDALIACAIVSNDKNHTQQMLQKIANWVDTRWRGGYVVDEQIELL